MQFLITIFKWPALKHRGFIAGLTFIMFFFEGTEGISQSSHTTASVQIGTVLKEYNSIISKYDLDSRKGRNNLLNNITPAERNMLEMLYNKMSRKQQNKQRVAFLPNVPAPREVIPTDKQLEEWENSNKYEVWIDGKKDENKTLANFSNTDFSTFSLTKLNKNTTNSGIPIYKVNLMTKEYYQETFKQDADKKYRTILVIRDK